MSNLEVCEEYWRKEEACESMVNEENFVIGMVVVDNVRDRLRENLQPLQRGPKEC